VFETPCSKKKGSSGSKGGDKDAVITLTDDNFGECLRGRPFLLFVVVVIAAFPT
jgi:hypothetical protein